MACTASVSGRSLAHSLQHQHRRSRPRDRAPLLRTQALFGFGKPKKSKEELEAEKEAEFRRQQEVLEARRTKKWHDEVAKRRGQAYVEERLGSLEPEPELPWAEQKRLIEEAAKAKEAEEKAAAAAAAAAQGK